MAANGNPYVRIAELEAQLTEKNTRIQTLESEKVAQETQSTTQIQQLESQLFAYKDELQAAFDQLQEMQKAEIIRLKKSSNWAAAAATLELLVSKKERELAEVKLTADTAKATELTKKLCSSHRQLGELYMKAEDLSKAEKYTRKAYDERVKVLGPDSYPRQFTQQQLCTILRKTGNDVKMAEAAQLYNFYWQQWQRRSTDEFVLECGHELGCLYQEQHRYDEALPLFQRVWEQRRNHTKSSVRKLSMSTVGQLLSILVLRGKEIERAVVLEALWAQHTGNLAGTAMLPHADALASIYWKDREYAKAKPVLEALWTARMGDVPIPDSISGAQRGGRLSTWFITGYRYANTLTKVGGESLASEQLRNELFTEARSVLERLWTARADLPSTIASDVTIVSLADYYAHMLSYSGNTTLAETVAGTAWRDATRNGGWNVNESILYLGEQYAKALNANGDTYEAKEVYKLLFAAWKELSNLETGDLVLAEAAIKCGRALLAILRARGKAPQKCKQLNKELNGLEESLRQRRTFAPQRRLAIRN